MRQAKGRRHVTGRMNGTEAEYARLFLGDRVWGFEAITLRLGDDCRYTPDFWVLGDDDVLEFHESRDSGGTMRWSRSGRRPSIPAVPVPRLPQAAQGRGLAAGDVRPRGRGGMRRDRAKDNAELFAVLWNDRDTAVEVIMQLFGYRNHWSVYRAAQRLGLPRRKRGSRSDYRTPAQVASTKRACLAAQQKRAHDGLTPVVRARIAVAMAAELPDIEGRTLVRCAVCQGRMELAAPHQHGAAA
jgi:hypothetical protein